MKHTVVISDVHLAEVEPGNGLWMRYRQKAFSPTTELERMLDELRSRVSGQDLELVFNGDIFDLDAPRVIDQESRFHNNPRDVEHSLPALQAILHDHPEFVNAVGRVVADGHSVVFIAGNHDVPLALPELKHALRDAIVQAALQQGASASVVALRAQVCVQSWLHKTTDGIVIEHGHQYDPYCSYRYPSSPFHKSTNRIQPTMGSLATRLLASRMGFFNPHVDDSCMMSGPGYVLHWFRYYMFSRHSLIAAWFFGAIRVLKELIVHRDPGDHGRLREHIRAAARETGVSLKAIAKHVRLFARPAEDRLRIVLRILWLDRVLLFSGAAIIGMVLAFLLPGVWAAVGAFAPLVLAACYELSTPATQMQRVWESVMRCARHIAKVHRAKAVVFGHTHHSDATWEDGVFFGNSGSWSAAYRDIECTQLAFEHRPLIWLTSVQRTLSGGLVGWNGTNFSGISPVSTKLAA